ncbi:hypothetical protein [Zhongshania sp. BJYM1]|uniref:hypothetical protein n=1 Tax=Zhongshania aquatica TaxID=2965069 RepID=UPI0022B46FFB|nr:hypothetical protein [Marortus sp. BJYM1]
MTKIANELSANESPAGATAGLHENSGSASTTDTNSITNLQVLHHEVLPDTISGRVSLALRIVTAPQKIRILNYLVDRPEGAYTHEIARDCAVCWPPNRLGELNHGVLARVGLYALCQRPAIPLTNRYGGTSDVHVWHLVKTDGGLVGVNNGQS